MDSKKIWGSVYIKDVLHLEVSCNITATFLLKTMLFNDD
jgi:hypothetical protein